MCYLALYLHYTSSNNPVLKTRKFSLYQLRCYETACPSIKNIFVSFVFTAVYNQFCRCYPSFNHCTKGFAVNVKGSFCSLRTRGVRSSNQSGSGFREWIDAEYKDGCNPSTSTSLIECRFFFLTFILRLSVFLHIV